LVFAGFDCRRWNRKKLKCFSVEPNFSPWKYHLCIF
jgi:hypothetical protein